MIKSIHAKNFKSWADTSKITFAPLTGLFGTNSSGKTSLLQILLMLKQTVESQDRRRVLDTGDDRSLVDLGTYYDVVYGHEVERNIQLTVDWELDQPLRIADPQKATRTLFEPSQLQFSVTVNEEIGRLAVEQFAYSFDNHCFGMKRKHEGKDKGKYDLLYENYQPIRTIGRPWPLPAPIKCYGFPDQATAYFQNVGFLSDFVLAFENLFNHASYLGPLREYPQRSYLWAGDDPVSVGRKGELAIPAMLAAKARKRTISLGKGRRKATVEERIGYWLREMGMIEAYSLREISKHRRDYELRVKTTKRSPEVLITDVGFGVSQILPVLVLCYYAPERSTIILEQPEIHLHPRVQAALADVFIEVVTKRQVQIVLESHSEHLLRRLQRRIAEGAIENTKTALYFCQMKEDSSAIDRLGVDMFGNIENWPEKFFGDEIGELAAMTTAAMKRAANN